jgi:hypothetical protein
VVFLSPDDIYNLCRESSNKQTKNIFYLLDVLLGACG